ncbi:hypothetical protein [Streptomyces sp. NBC_00134]|uniref:hypothetical protein n=1 Tax=Streptomyces sp. NBC_00134 TaxID=2975663 RepID=UPI003247F4A0
MRYEIGDVAELPPLDRRFDVAVGVQCLNYAEDIPEMEGQVRVGSAAGVRAGIREYGEDFWADVLANPPLEVLRCRA